MVRLVSIKEMREMSVAARAGYVRQLTQSQKTLLINRLAESTIRLGLIQHDNSVSISLLSKRIEPGWDHYLPEEFE